MLSASTIATVKATVPALQQHGEAITSHFYQLMFREHPEVKAFFNQAHQGAGSQQRALAGAVLAYAGNIDRLEALAGALPLIVQKHAGLGVLPEHYPIVGKCLLQAIRDVLGAVATDEIIDAWAQAYGMLAKILIDAEEAVYRERETASGGWRGTRRFVLERRLLESDIIASFHLRPEDGKPLPSFEPGQYLTLVLNIDGETVRRNYSLSCAPNASEYRISVKREPGGRVSNWLHDHLLVGSVVETMPPSGEFALPQESQRTLLFVTGGVGITPALSMLHSAAAGGRTIHFVHAARNSRVHAFADEVNALAQRHPNIQPRYLYDEPLPEDRPHGTGRVNASVLAEILRDERDVDLLLVGPKPFMQGVYGDALSVGIAADRIHYECFGPLESLAQA